MKHGQIIKNFQRTHYGPEQTLVHAKTGETVYVGPMSSMTRPVEVRHCDTCGEVEIEGICSIIVADEACPKCGNAWGRR